MLRTKTRFVSPLYVRLAHDEVSTRRRFLSLRTFRNRLCDQMDNTSLLAALTRGSRGVNKALTIDRPSELAYIRLFPDVQPFRSNSMIAELRSFPGVSCLRCGNPIPVSARIVDIQDDIANGGTDVPYAFRVRCRICEYETIYEAGRVQTFDGEPRKRGTRKRAA